MALDSGYSARLKARAEGSQWTIRSINGKKLPVLPKNVVHELYVVDRDSYDDTNGNLQRTIVGEKDKIILSFPAMYQQSMDDLIATVPTGKLTVVLEKFQKPSQTRTGYFYRGDIKKNPYMQLGVGNYLYDSGTEFALIEYNTRKINT